VPVKFCKFLRCTLAPAYTIGIQWPAMKPMVASRKKMTFGFLVGMLFLILGLELALSINQLSQTWDESQHIAAGYQYWHERDFAANAEHPPLVKVVAALPLLTMKLRPLTSPPGNSKQTTFNRGFELLYSNDADAILLRTRMATSIFTFLMALLVFFCAYELFGSSPALLALLLLVFEPNVLAHGALVTTDVGAACTLFGATYLFYRFITNPTSVRLIVSGGMAGLALAAKHSGLLIIPIFVFLVAYEVSFHAKNRFTYARNLIPRLVVLIVIAYLVLWAFYTFRYSARPDGGPLMPSLEALSQGLQNPYIATAIQSLANMRLLPEAYLWGLSDILYASQGRPMFLLGEVYSTGQWFYFPIVFLLKSTLGFLVLLVSLPWVPRFWRKYPKRNLAFMGIPLLVYVCAALSSGLNIGIRHLLPAYPFLIVVVAVTAWNAALRLKFGRILLAACCAFHIASSLHSFPNYLTYSNEVVGGPTQTYRYTSDSNSDWGQGLKQLKTYLRANNTGECWFAYTIPLPDLTYYKIPCKRLPSAIAVQYDITNFPAQDRTVNGTVFVSAGEAAGQYWGPDELNPYRVFWERTPDAVIGNTILVFHGSFNLPLAAAMSHVSQARSQAYQHQPMAAMEETDAAVQLAPESAEVRVTRCQVLRDLLHAPEATGECRRALELARAHHPDFQLSWSLRLRALAK
jgi:hypothetical protein